MIPSRMRLLLPRRGRGMSCASKQSPTPSLATLSMNPPAPLIQSLQPPQSPSCSTAPFASSSGGNGIVFLSDRRRRQSCIFGYDNRICNNINDTERIRNSLNGTMHGVSSPLLSTTTFFSQQTFFTATTINNSPLYHPSRYQIRLFTSKNNDKANKEGAENKTDPESKTPATAPNNPTQIQELVENTVESVRPIVESAEANLKKAADVVRLGDLASVYGIVLIVFLIVTLPFVARRIRGNEANENRDVDPEDPVMDLAKMLRNEYLGQSNGEDNSASAMGLDRIAADLMRSPQIQEAVNNLVANIIQSPQFKQACQLLLKELLRDLLDDPDTLKQVIHLLQNAIADDKIKEASIQLVTEVFADDRVLDELVILVQRLGMEQQVQAATQALLVESAHNALNDPEILDHSMEFATDVVGDDVVQQTAGEALYNTLSYAVRPTLSVFLSILGIGLIALSLSAFRNANESSSAKADHAFMKSVEEFSERLLRVVSFPLDFLIACKDAVVNLFMFPFRVVSRGFSETKRAGGSLIDYLQNMFMWLISLPGNLISSALEKCGTTYHQLGSMISSQVEKAGRAVSTSSFGRFVQKCSRRLSGWFPRSKVRWSKLNHRLADMAISVEGLLIRVSDPCRSFIAEALPRWGKQASEGVDTARDWTLTMQRRTSASYHKLNRSLADWARSVEGIIERIRNKIDGLK